jgi:hypothetical protein
MKLTTHLQLVPRSRMVDLFLHSLIRLHDVVLNKLSPGLYFYRLDTNDVIK